MPPWYNYNWRDWRVPPWDVPVKTSFVSAEKAYIWRMHLNTPRILRKELHQQLAIKYNCTVKLVADCIFERGHGWSPSPPPQPGSRSFNGNGNRKARKQIMALSSPVGVDMQSREVEVAVEAEAGGPEAGPSRPRLKQWRPSSAQIYVEVSTVAEIRARYRASSASRSAEEAVTSSSGSLDPGPTLRRSTRKRKQTEKTRDNTPMKRRIYEKQVPAAEATSSENNPTSIYPATTSSSESSRAQTLAYQGGFRSFLQELQLDRIVPIFAEYGFITAEDVKVIKKMTTDTRKQLFEWLIEDGKINLKELAILHENLISKM
ncbi:uncharacterized protein PHACADRAFT_134267 [Phanerochaete carnosa HHB-10118-sp]|uniref:Uncharacterized protein n=1 Tax=Phanerochaete carnosa (strain HHB-10118-sp) TaxID=650164 RepID=K5WAW0_PHACS|nr:uncharacterized protein PHACADRAFT_134267 [Phanerochaete carnosa HHB-10118-sp]EKM61093.1 hypothetical protein PHACADRAFT_134267 [Phanerochaete carnosa HHB-10118-sp]